jgi:hypothetical protein
MSEQDPEIEAFSKLIVALEPWLGEVVLVGGWAHRLYRLDPRARKLDYLPLTTLDGDVAIPSKLKKEESTVRKRLLAAGFLEEFIGGDRPPRDALPLRKRRWFLRRISGTARRKSVRPSREAEGDEGSGGRVIPAASLYRCLAPLALGGSARQGKRIPDVTEADCADRQPCKLPGTKNPHP